jgi:hypothetical protein
VVPGTTADVDTGTDADVHVLVFIMDNHHTVSTLLLIEPNGLSAEEQNDRYYSRKYVLVNLPHSDAHSSMSSLIADI